VRKLSPRGRTVVFGLVLVVLVAILFPAVVTAKYVVVIDDGSHGFEKHGPAKWWHKVRGIGFGGDMFWTWNNKNRVDNYVIWRPNLKYTGYYKVYVFIPRNYAYTKNAYYEIYHAHGKTVKKIDQSRYYDKWVYLGKYYFKAGKGYVKLTDKTGERWATKKIGFDAIKFELVKKTKSKPKQGILLHFDLNFKGSLSDAKHKRGDGKDEKTIAVKPGQELRLYIFYKEGNTKNPYIVRVYPSWDKNRFIANSDNNEQISEVGWEIGGGRWDVQKFKAPTKPGKYEIRVVYKKGKQAPTYYRYDRLLARGYITVYKPRFKQDDLIQTTARLNVRKCPDLSCQIFWTVDVGKIGRIVSGPRYADGYVWFKIHWENGKEGWSAQNWLIKIGDLIFTDAYRKDGKKGQDGMKDTAVLKLTSKGIEAGAKGKARALAYLVMTHPQWKGDRSKKSVTKEIFLHCKCASSIICPVPERANPIDIEFYYRNLHWYERPFYGRI